MSGRLAYFSTRKPMRLSVIAVLVPALFGCHTVAMAQVGEIASPTSAIAPTSPLGIEGGSAVSQTGIPLGSTEIATRGTSPVPVGATGTISMPVSGTTCSTAGTSPSGMFGSTASFDGGGTAAGNATSGVSTTSGMLDTSGLSGMCGSGSSSAASSSTPASTSPLTLGGAARTGIPLGSVEIGNLGVSSAAAVPTMGVSPTAGPAPMMPPLLDGSPTTPNTIPCPTTGASIVSGGC
jgi:hypothetical protein